MKISIAARLLLLALPIMAVPAQVAAFGFGNMMNPNKWFGGDRDYDDDYYYDDYGPAGGYGYPGGGYYGAPAYGAPGYGAPGYAAPAYGAPGYAAPGYAAPGYAAPGGYASPAYTAPAASAPAPAGNSSAVIDSDTAEIERLKARVRELEGAQPGAGGDVWQAPAAQGDYAAPDAWNSGAGASGDSINTWQAPMQPSGQDNAVDTPHPSDWRPSYSTLPGSSGGWNSNAGSTERGAAAYRPPTQYPGQQMYDLGR